MRLFQSKRASAAFLATFFLATFIADLIVPYGYGEWVLYILGMVLAMRVATRRMLFAAAGATSAFLVIGFLWGPTGGLFWPAVYGRSLGLILTWAIVWVALRWRRSDENVQRVNRALKTISECNQVLVRAHEEGELLQHICRILVDEGGYGLAWVGLAEQDEAKTIRVAARAGVGGDYLDDVRLSWAETELDAAAVAIRQGEVCLARNAVQAMPTPWRIQALRCGHTACVALPLQGGERPLGALSVCSSNPEAFNADEMKLLEELSHDLAYGIRALRNHAERQRAEEELRKSEAQYRTVVENIPQKIVLKSKDFRWVSVNERFARDLGVSPREIVGKVDYDLFPKELADKYRADDQRVIETGTTEEFDEEYNEKGQRCFVHTIKTPVRGEDGQVIGVLVVFWDVTERKLSDEALRRQAALLDQSYDATLVWELDGLIVYWNQGAERLYGIPPAQAVGRASHVLLHTVFPESLAKCKDALLRTGHWEGVLEHQTDEGRHFFVDSRMTLLQEARGPLVLEANRDFSERKRAEEELRLSRERLALAFRAGRSGSFEYEPQSNRNLWSPEIEEIYGVEPGGFGGTYQAWEQLVHPEDRESAKAAVQESFKTGELKGEWRVQRRRDGEIRWLEARGKVSFDDGGKPVRMIGINTDITDRKLAEKQFAAQGRITEVFLKIPDDQMYGEVLKIILDFMESEFGVFGYIDENGANVVPSMTRHIWDKCQVPEKNIVFPRATWGDSSWPRALLEKKPNFTNQVSTKTPPGHVEIRRHISLPILYQGEAIGLFQVANRGSDYTEVDVQRLELLARHIAPILNARLQRDREEGKRRKAEEEIRGLNESLERRVRERTAELEAANKELEAFTYSVSHDLRAPLRHVDGFSRLLTEEFGAQLPEGAKHFLQRIQSGTRQMGNLVDDLLNLSRIGRREPVLQITGLNSLVTDVVDDLKAENSGRKIVWKTAPLPFVECDPALIKQVLANLLSNALKFTRPRDTAEIEVGTVRLNGRETIFVRDNGVGFSMKYADKLFGVFQRLHRAEDFEGTGVGLATVQRIVHKHHGEVWAEGELDRGATFYFTLGTEARAAALERKAS